MFRMICNQHFMATFYFDVLEFECIYLNVFKYSMIHLLFWSFVSL
jgi:hypothetical protein